MAVVLAQQLKGLHAEVQPVTVHTPYPRDVLTWEGETSAVEHFGKISQKALDRFTAQARAAAPGLAWGEPRVLRNVGDSGRSAVEALLRHLTKGGFGLVAVATHGRKGLQRLLLGSFTETLLTRCPIPVLVLPAHSSSARARASALLATDLSVPSLRASQAVIEFCKKGHLKLLAYNVTPELAWTAGSSALVVPEAPWMLDPTFRRREQRTRKQLLDRICGEAKRRGVSASGEMKIANKNAAEAIVDHARTKGVDRIYLNSTRTPGSALLLGSTARQVIRLASCPVWVFRVGSERRNLRKPSQPGATTYVL
jgi:nucleotide-binding universal stress UspA family protein